MRAEHARDDRKKGPGRNGLFAEFGARIVRSLFFWGLAAILASSAYTGIVRIRGNRMRVTEGEARTRTTESDGRIQEQLQSEAGQEAIPAATQATARKTGTPDLTGQTDTSDPGERGECRRVALTFDDGPHPYYTEELLDGLKERGAKATFFVVGENIPGNENVIRRMNEEGHLIGNHTYDHVKISDMNEKDACEQIEKTSALIRELTGKDTEFVRPPFGAWKKDLECSFVMIPVLWDVDPKDWTTNNASDVVRRVMENVKNGDIILLHDYYKSSVEAALRIVDKLQEQGYEFVTVDELILE